MVHSGGDKREEDLKAERDKWQEQAARLTLAPPVPMHPEPTGW